MKTTFKIITLLLVIILGTAAVSAQQAGTGGRPPGGPGNESFFNDGEASDAHCGFTDETTSGPYYISGTVETENINVQDAPGTPMTISGVVYDGSTGNPIPNAKVEIWHTDADGHYWPEAQGDAADFDETDLNLRGTILADEQGAYTFDSIEPAIYENRRRHIHYLVTADGYLPVFTQSYWLDDPNTATDNVDSETESCRVLAFEEAADGSTSATFDIYLRPDPDFIATAEATAEPVVCSLLNLNDLSEDQLLSTIPNFPNRMVREFFEYRPYASIQEYRREIGKYVGDDLTAEWEQYIFVPVDLNNSDAETLKQLPGVDDTIAASLIAGRPYASNEAFVSALSASVTPEQAAQAACYLQAITP